MIARGCEGDAGEQSPGLIMKAHLGVCGLDMDGNLGEVRSFDMVIPESGRTTRQVLKRRQTRYALQVSSQKKTTSPSSLRRILGRRLFKTAGMRRWDGKHSGVRARIVSRRR